MMLKKSNVINDNFYNDQLNNIEWQPVNWPLIETSMEMPSDSDLDEDATNRKSAKKSLNYFQPKRTIYRPIRAQRCLKRGSNCDPGSNPILNCCSHSVCRCNLFSNQCRCDRMSLIMKFMGK